MSPLPQGSIVLTSTCTGSLNSGYSWNSSIITEPVYYYYYYYYIVVVVASCHRPFLPGTFDTPLIPTAQASSFTLQYFPYYVWCSKYTCLLLNVFLEWLPNFSSHFLFLFRWPQLLLVYINSYIFFSFLFPFAWHFCPLVLLHLSVCMMSLFCF